MYEASEASRNTYHAHTSTTAGIRYFVDDPAPRAQPAGLRHSKSKVVPNTWPNKKVTILSNERMPEISHKTSLAARWTALPNKPPIENCEIGEWGRGVRERERGLVEPARR